MEISEILEAFKLYDGIYKREHVEEAVKRRDEIIPHLIAILERIVSDPTPYIDNDDRFDHLYAFVLLEHFGDPRAHDVFVNILKMPGDIPDEIFGDIITENFPSALFRTCNGSIEKIKSLVLNKESDSLCRDAGLKAIAFAVVDGIVPRKEVMDFLGSLFTGTEANIEYENDCYFWSYVVDCACDIYPEELMPVIKKAYKDGLIDPWYIALEDCKDDLRLGKNHAYNQMREEMKRRMPEDVHDYISWWACFKSTK